MPYPKRSQYKYAKPRYLVRNWAHYEAGLQRRGALTVWLSESALGAWRAPATGRPGGQRAYSELPLSRGQGWAWLYFQRTRVVHDRTHRTQEPFPTQKKNPA